MLQIRRRWRVLVGTAAALAVVLVLGGAIALRLYWAHRLERAVERFEGEVGSLELAAYAPPPIEDRRENAASWLRAGADALLLDDGERALVHRRVGALGEPWPAVDADAFAVLLARHQAARGLMDGAAALERSSFEIDYQRGVAAVAVDELVPVLRAGRLLAVECDYRQQRGELEPALAALHLLERLTAALRAESTIGTLLFGSALEGLYHDRLEAALQALSDPEALRALRRDLRHLDAASAPPQRPFAGTTAAAFHGLSQNVNEWPDWPAWAARPEPWSPKWMPQWTPGRVRPFLTAIGVDQQAAWWLEAGIWMANSVNGPAVRSRVDPVEQSRYLNAMDTPLPVAVSFGPILGPDQLEALRREQWTRAARSLGLFALDLRLSRIGHGSYPLQPTDLPASSATGETAVYRILDDGAVEIAFPAAEAGWEEEKKSWTDSTARLLDHNLRWRLPP